MNLTISQESPSLWDYTELTLTADFKGNPFTEAEFSALFTCGDKKLTLNGFYDGNGEWKIRFMPVCSGEWRFVTFSNIPDLDNKEGRFTCSEATEGVHGMVEVADTIHFRYTDGAPFYPVGTTCYVWNLQGPELEGKTLRSLEKSPFNKIRFCVYPKRYTFNHNEPPD